MLYLYIFVISSLLPGAVFSSFEHLILQENNATVYNKFDLPKTGAESVQISVYIHIESLREITSETTLDFYLVQFWNDTRLVERNDELKVTGRTLPDNVWYPDTYFLLVRDQLYSAEEHYIIFRPQGMIEYNRKVRLKTPCSPNVLLFPFDVVTCRLVLSSFGYTKNEVEYSWLSNPDGVYIDASNNNVDHLGFYLQGKIEKEYAKNYASVDYSALETVIYLKRKYTAYLMQVYFPAALIVILSWTIFWINLQATPARASLGVTTVLTMLTLATQSTSQNAKHVNGKVTALDLYLWACFVFVIFAMLEFAMSDFTTHSSRKAPKTISEQASRPRTVSVCSPPPGTNSTTMGSPDYPGEKELMLQSCNGRANSQDSSEGIKFRSLSNKNSNDYVIKNGRGYSVRSLVGYVEGKEKALNLINNSARVLFPVLFLIFNLAYWITLLIMIAITSERNNLEGGIIVEEAGT